MARNRRFNWILLFMALVVLAAMATVLFVTHPAEERATSFWVTFAFLSLAVVVTFAAAALQNSLDLEGKKLPLPLFMGLTSIVVVYDLFVAAAPLLLWKGLGLSPTTYVLTHIVGLALFLVLGGSALMASLASTERAERGQGGSAAFARRADEARELSRRAASRGDDALARAWDKAAEALLYADPVGTEASASLERSLDQTLTDALALDLGGEGARKTSRLLAQTLSENLLRRRALLLREK